MKTKTTFGISFPNPDLLEQAKRKSAAHGLSLSGYVNQLLRRDMGLPSMIPTAAPADAVEEPRAAYGVAAQAAHKARRKANG